MTIALREAAKTIGVKGHTGIGQTKDAFYTEGQNNLPLAEQQNLRWKAWERANVISTSMEASALFVVASIRRVRVGEVMAVIGLTYKDEPIVKKVGVEDAIKCAIEAMKILMKADK